MNIVHDQETVEEILEGALVDQNAQNEEENTKNKGINAKKNS